MNYSHPHDKAQAFASQAIEKLASIGLSPTPEGFELWYVYFSDENPEVSHALDLLMDNNEEITDEKCKQIHSDFLSETTEAERVKDAGNRIQNTIKEINDMVGTVQETTEDYSTKLNDVSDQLSPEMTQEQVTDIISDIQNNTQHMLSQNKALESELSRSVDVMAELQHELDAVRKEAMTDGLTDIPNRKAFDNKIQDLIQIHAQEGEAFSLILMDIDHFKKFNDTFGHLVGDQVLRLVAKTLIDGVKGKDMAARYGGEEFAILLPETNMNGAMHLADRLRKDVEVKEVVNRASGEKMGRITLSGGVAEYIANEDVADFIARADAALYAAKNKGRNQVAPAALPGEDKAAG